MLTAAQINLKEASYAIKIQLQKFGKEISRDYNINVPYDVENITDEELNDWIMSVKDRIIKQEHELERKSILVILLKSYENSLNQIAEYENKNGINPFSN